MKILELGWNSTNYQLLKTDTSLIDSDEKLDLDIYTDISNLFTIDAFENQIVYKMFNEFDNLDTALENGVQ